jgi:hypothetical protein
MREACCKIWQTFNLRPSGDEVMGHDLATLFFRAISRSITLPAWGPLRSRPSKKGVNAGWNAIARSG